MVGEGLQGGRILIVHQGGLGDFILALPAIKALRDALQPVWLEIMGHPWILHLVAGRYYADAIHDVNRAEMALFFQENTTLPDKMCRYLSGFDTAIIFGSGTTLAQNLCRTGIPMVFILPPFPEGRRHLVDHHLSSLKSLGIYTPPTPPRIFLRGEDREWAEEFLRQKRWDLNEICVLHPGSGSPTKAWHPQRFAALGRALAYDGKKVLIIQGPADSAPISEVVAGLSAVPYLVAHDLPVINIAALLSCACFYIGNDSGITHLAAAVGIPIVAIFGPTDPRIWAPRSERAWWLQGEAGCAPCSLHQRQACERQRCLEAISVEDILMLISDNIKGPCGALPPDTSRSTTDGIPCHDGARWIPPCPSINSEEVRR